MARMRTAAIAVGVLAAMACAYLAGHQSYGTSSSLYTHAEVLDIASKCNAGSYIGKCIDCKQCGNGSYNAGGCSYFRNTYCSLCTTIRHCQQQYHKCTTKHDEVCTQCETGHWGDRCKRCTVCPRGTYQTHKCTQTRDTVCEVCSPCMPGTFLSRACSRYQNTKCTKCTDCAGKKGFYEHKKCESNEGSLKNVYERVAANPEIVYKLQKDTQCKKCTSLCPKGEFISEVCTPHKDAKCSACHKCVPGQFISRTCQHGSYRSAGRNARCRECTKRPDGHWTSFPCHPLSVSDAVHQQCTTCAKGEYKHMGCTNFHDTICPDCTKIKNCKKGHEVCTNAKDQKCTKCKNVEWTGKKCCYKKTHGKCTVDRDAARRRTPYALGFRGRTAEEFVQFCTDLCDEFPDCMAVQVHDGGKRFTHTGENFQIGRLAHCEFFAAYTDAKMTDAAYDCHSNTCRQGGFFPKKFYYITEEGKRKYVKQ